MSVASDVEVVTWLCTYLMDQFTKLANVAWQDRVLTIKEKSLDINNPQQYIKGLTSSVACRKFKNDFKKNIFYAIQFIVQKSIYGLDIARKINLE